MAEAKPRLLERRSNTPPTAVNNINIDNDDDGAEGGGVYDSGSGGNND